VTRRPCRPPGRQQAATSARLRKALQIVELPHQRKVCDRYTGAGSRQTLLALMPTSAACFVNASLWFALGNAVLPSARSQKILLPHQFADLGVR
jgi:hypothetical protein